MALSNLQLSDALHDIFKKKPLVAQGTVKVVLDQPITPAQTKALAGFCLTHDQYPTVARSGAGLTVSFT